MAVLLCLLLAPPFGQAQIVREHELVLPAATKLLVIVQQLGTDVRITRYDGDSESRVIDHPIGRTGPEIFSLGPYQEERDVVLQFTHPYRDPQAVVEVVPIDEGTPVSQAADLLTRAGELSADLNESNLALALDLYSRAAELDTVEYNLSQYARLLQASLLLKTTDLAESLALLEQVDTSFLGDFAYKKQWMRADIANGQDDYRLAREIYQPLISSLRDSSPEFLGIIELDLAEMEGVLGFAQILTGEPQLGRSTLESALDIAERYGDVNLTGELHNNLAGYYSFSTNYAEAAEHFSQAIDYLWSTGDTQSIVYTLSNMSLNYADLGEYTLARDTAHMALMRAEEGLDASQMSTAYTRLTALYLRMGEYGIAADFARLAQQYDLQTDREWRAFTVKAIEGEAQLGQGLVDQAIETLVESLDYFQRNGPTQRIITTQQRLIEAYLEEGDLDSASQTLREAMALSQQSQSPGRGGRQTALLLLRAEILMAQDNAAEAVAILELIEENLDEYISPRHVEVAALLMEAYAALGQSEKAIGSGYQAVEYITIIRRQLEFSRLGPAWSGETHPVYLNLMHNLLQAAQQTDDNELRAKAFQVTEEGLANNLAQQLLVARSGGNEESEETRRLRRELTNLARRRAASVGTGDYSDNTLEYFKVRERYQASLDLDPIAPDLEVPSISALQARLGRDDVVLEFACVPDRSCHGFAITREDFKVRQLGDFAEVETLAREIQLGARDSRGNVSAVAQRLGILLMADLLPSDRSNIYLIANYPLGTLPWALLGAGQEDRYVPLANDYRLTLLPSLTTFYHMQEPAEREFLYELAVLADPEFTVSDNQPLVSTPADGAVDNLRGWYDELERLPWSAREAENLRDIFTGLPVRTMTGRQASKSNLLDEATRNSRIVHIASHGYFNAETPDLVGIATTPQPDEAGFVTLDDLILYPFNAELVVISGCETGLGQERGGEGLMSLSRGFLGQGVDHVISTLWPVSDRASAEFMRLFYTALQVDGRSPAEALTTAQNQLARNPQYRAPFYWASYILTSMSL